METTDKTVAMEIVRQLGGRKFIAMTGIRKFYCDNDGVSMKLPQNKLGNMTFLKIELAWNDTYTMTFSKCGKEVKQLHSCQNVYNEDLQEIFTNVTGLNTHL